MKKSVLLLHADQMRLDGLGCSGNPFARTPNLDRLAASGTFCSRHIACNPICQPSRASLLTGLYPPGHNVWTNGIALNRREYCPADSRYNEDYGINPAGFCFEPQTLADLFASAGYDTASFGKLHLTPNLSEPGVIYPENFAAWDDGRMEGWCGPYYGFKHVELTLGHGEEPCQRAHYGRWLAERAPEMPRRLRKRKPVRPLADQPDLYESILPFDLHNSAWLAERTCDFIRKERAGGEPFLAFVGFPDPHHSFLPCAGIVKDFLDIDVHEPLDPEGAGMPFPPAAKTCRHRSGTYPRENILMAIRYTYAMIHQIDIAVGRILDALDETGLADETIVVFTADHGDFLGDHDRLYKSTMVADSLLRVPLILRAPGSGLPARIDFPVSNCDVMPTLASLCGLVPEADLHGTDLTRPEPAPHAFCFSADSRRTLNHTVYDARYRLSWYPGANHVELYDHSEDPAEVRNLAADQARSGLVEELLSRIEHRLATCYNPTHPRLSAW